MIAKLKNGILPLMAATAFVLGGIPATAQTAADEPAAAAAPTAGQAPAASDDGAASAAGSTDEAAEGEATNRITRNGLTIEFDAKPILGSFEDDRALVEGDYGLIRFTITDAASGVPVPSLSPGAWIDLAETADGERSQALRCKDRVGLYLRGSTGTQPLIDLNSYFILAMNEDATISVIDPNVMIAGIGNMFYTQILLPRPGGDWVQKEDQTRLYVSMPRADQVAVIDTETFKALGYVKTGPEPLRVALQGDERYLWVTYNAKGDMGGVTVIDTQTREVVAQIETGRGHHELAFSGDDSHALVTNRTDGTVSVIDVQTLKKVKDITIGSAVMSLGYSSLGRAFYVADGAMGKVAVINEKSLEVTAWIAAQPGLGPLAVTQDGRWVLITNAAANLLHVIDTSANAIAHDLKIPGSPYQVSVTRAFAYVRSLETERVGLIELAKLDQAGKLAVVPVPFGSKAPGQSSSLSVAAGIVEAAGEAGVVAVSPADNTLSFYMEGMSSPMGTFQSYGHNPRAVLVTDRALIETKPGVYTAKTQIPSAGRYDAALVVDSPPILHCFSFEAKVNPSLQKDLKPLAVEYLVEEDRTVSAEAEYALRFRLSEPASEAAATGLEDVRVLFYRAPGFDRTEVLAREVEAGLYEAALPIRKAGGYYVYVGSLSKDMPYGELPYLTLRAVKAPATKNGRTGG